LTTTSEPSPAWAEPRYALVAWLLALATLVDHVRLASLADPWRAATVLAAFAVLWRPASARRLLVMVAAQTVELAGRLPYIDNLQSVLTLLGVAQLAAYALAARRTRGEPTGPAWLAEVEPAVRATTVAVYACAAWHKLNRDFFDPAVSCGVALYDNMLRQAWMPDGVLPPGDSIAPLLIYGTLAAELGMPLLLAFARTARFGIVVGLVFHFVLGLARFYEFSSLAVVLLLLFAPPELALRLRDRWRALDRRRLALAAFAVAAPLLAVAAWQTAAQWDPALPLRRAVRFAGHLVLGYAWWLSAIPLAIGARELFRLPPATPRPRFAPPHPLLWSAPLLALLNGLSPHLGLKTEFSFAMYSNLRTEGGESNHLLLPAPLPLGGYQEELVRLLETSDRSLAKSSPGGEPVPFAAVRRVAHFAGQRGGPARVVYERDGVVYEVPPLDADPALTRPNLWERKLLHFRVVQASPVKCGH